MFRSVKKAIITICLVAVFAFGFFLGRGQLVAMETVMPAWKQALTDVVDLQQAKEYIAGFAPGIKEYAAGQISGLIQMILEKIL